MVRGLWRLERPAPATRQAAPRLPTEEGHVGDVLYVHVGEQRPASRTAGSIREEGAALYSLAPGASSWTTKWTGGIVRGARLVSDGETLYRVGGEGPSGNRSAARPDLERWDWSDERWVSLTPMPDGRTDRAAVVVGRQLWVIGGWAPSVVAEGLGARLRPPEAPLEDWRDDVLVANLDAEPVSWTVVETASLRLHSLAAAVHGEAIWVVGGMTPEGPGLEAIVWTCNPEACPPVPAGRRPG